MNELYTQATPQTACALCGVDRSRVLAQRDGRELRQCRACGLAWVPQGVMCHADGTTIYEHDPPVFLTDVNHDYYQDDDMVDSARAKLAWVATHAPGPAPLLDVGANFGHFVREAAAMYEAVGLEPSPTCVASARASFGIALERGSIDADRPEFEDRFRVVTMFDVIEHVPDARRALERVRHFLASDGRLFITTPDSGSVTARVLGNRWYHYDLVQHVALFNRRNLTALLDQTGFAVESIRTFGRRYRLSYVEQRFEFMARSSALWRLAHLAVRPFRLVRHRHIRVNLGDVMGVVARVRR